MEGTEDAHVTASGMSAISSCILQLCQSGDHIISSSTIYGGTYAFLNNFAPRLGIKVSFVDINDKSAVESAMTEQTKIIYCESISNPLMNIPDFEMLSKIAAKNKAVFMVDNTFSPMIFSPVQYGADVVLYSMTKFINGSSDCVAGAVCATKDFIMNLMDVNNGACMLLGPALDSLRASSILKNLHTLHIRMKQHSQNALYLATLLHDNDVKVYYPGLPDHPQHELMSKIMNKQFGFGGMIAFEVGTLKRANRLMVLMQEAKVGYLAVSLGYFKTLFSAPAHSTSSEIPEDLRKQMGLTDSLVRLSVGLDNDIERIGQRILECFKKLDK